MAGLFISIVKNKNHLLGLSSRARIRPRTRGLELIDSFSLSNLVFKLAFATTTNLMTLTIQKLDWTMFNILVR